MPVPHALVGTEPCPMEQPIGEHNLIGEKLCRVAAYTLALEAVMAFCGAWANKKGDLRLESAAAKIIGSEWYWEAVNGLFKFAEVEDS